MSIDLNYRPTSYADFDDPVALALNGIKGQMRREMARDMLEADGEKRAVYDALLGTIEDRILEESSPEESIQALNRVHGPWWMGGEYLPTLAGREVEIARIVLRSTLMDVFSIRARRADRGYRYSMEDEYETEFRMLPAESDRTLMLSELIGLIDTAEGHLTKPGRWSFVEGWWWQEWNSGCDRPPEECTAFAWVESEQYPQLGDHYKERARLWRIDRVRERAAQEGGER